MEKELKTGTTTVGLVCKDAIILAADKRATAGYIKVDSKVEKVRIVTPNIAITIAGTVSDVQLMEKLLRAELKLKEIKTNREPTTKEAANLLAGMTYHNIRKFSSIPGISHFLIAGADKEGIHLYDIFPDGSLSEVDSYVTSGSGMVFALGVFETLYKKNMSKEEGIKLAIKAVNAALQRDIASGDGIDIVEITKDGAKKIQTQQLDYALKE